MSLREHWVLECDHGDCPARRDLGPCARTSEARWGARVSGWASRGPWTDCEWFCPDHALDAFTWLREDHEDWCPASSRGGPCSCQAGTCDSDEAVWKAKFSVRHYGREIVNVRPPGDILLRSSARGRRHGGNMVTGERATVAGGRRPAG